MATTGMSRRSLERAYANLWRAFASDALWFQVESELGGADVLDTWRPYQKTDGGQGSVRACPARLVHIMAGNGPGVASMTVIRSALTRSASLLKLPSNDLFTATAILRYLIAVAPGHPLTRSFSAVYWSGETKVSSGFCSTRFGSTRLWFGVAKVRSAPPPDGWDPAWSSSPSIRRTRSPLSARRHSIRMSSCAQPPSKRRPMQQFRPGGVHGEPVPVRRR